MVFSEDVPVKGKLFDVAVFLRQAVQFPVTLSTKDGKVIKVGLEAKETGDADEAAILTDLDLIVLEATA